MNPILELKQVSYAYHTLSGETFALSNLSFSVENGEFIAIVGPSGCGKSTLLSLIAGLIKPEEGKIIFSGNEGAIPNIGYMLQKDHLFEWRSVYSNVMLGLEIQKKVTPETISYVENMLKSYGLYRFKDSKPSQLSGGMRQRAALIRTLALEPEILLLDEPFSALDYQTRLNVSDDIGTIIKKQKKTAILVTHDLSEAISLSDRVIILTKRPGTVKRVLPIHFDIEHRTPIKCRNTPEFQEYFNMIWKELNANDEAISGTAELY